MQHQRHCISTAFLLTLALAVPGTVLAYDAKDAVRDCEMRLRSDYDLTDLRDAHAVQLSGDKNYRVTGNTKIDGDKYPWTCDIEKRRIVAVDYSNSNRRHSQRSSRFDGGTPEVAPRRSGEVEVRMPGGCTVLYDRNGELRNRGSSCSSDDRRRADKAADAYFHDKRNSGRDNEYARGGNNEQPPEIMMGRNGEGEVIFKNNCVVYYNQRGRRTEALPKCSDRQVNKAEQAMRSYRREQGM